MKTKDGYNIYVDMWISNNNGIYCVKEISNNYVYVREILFDDDNSDNYSLGDELRMSEQEIKQCSYL